MEDHNIEATTPDHARSRRNRWRLIQLVLGLAIWAGLIVAVVVGWEGVSGELSRVGAMFPLAVLMILLGWLAGARGWAELNPREIRRRAAVGYLAAQPARYLPVGGAVLAASQVGLTATGGSNRRDVGWTFLVHAGTQITASLLIALLVIPAEFAGAWVRVGLVVAAAVSVLCTRESVVGVVIRRLSGIIPKLKSSGQVPPTAALWRSVGWSILLLILFGVAFALLLDGFSGLRPLAIVVGVFSISWLVSFLAVPFPAGLGVRELVLVGLLPGFAPAFVVGVSLLHRFASIVAEIVLLAVVTRSAFFKRSTVSPDHDQERRLP